MTDYLDRAVAHLGIDPGSVVKHRQEGDVYVLLSDQGIAGVKKYRLPLSRLEGEPEHDPEPQVEPEPEPDPIVEPDPDPEAVDDEPEEEVYACPDCGRDFDTERGLSVHQRYCDILPDEEE